MFHRGHDLIVFTAPPVMMPLCPEVDDRNVWEERSGRIIPLYGLL